MEKIRFIEYLNSIINYYNWIKNTILEVNDIFDILIIEKLIEHAFENGKIEFEIIERIDREIAHISQLLRNYLDANEKEKEIMIKSMGESISKKSNDLFNYAEYVDYWVDFYEKDYILKILKSKKHIYSPEELSLILDKYINKLNVDTSEYEENNISFKIGSMAKPIV